MRLSLRFALAAFAVLVAATFLAGCRKKEEEKPPQAIVPGPVATIAVASSASVSGTIRTPDGIDPRGILVFAEGTSRVAVTNIEGEFVIDGLAPDFYAFRAMGDGLEPLSLAQLTLRDTDMGKVHDLGEFQMSEGGTTSRGAAVATVRGVVVTTNPEDVAGVLVEVAGSEYRTVTDAIGNFALPNLPAGVHPIRFSKIGYRSETRSVTVEAGRDAAIEAVRLTYEDFAVVGGRTIFGTVRVLGVDGRPARQRPPVSVSLQGAPYSAQADQAGRFALSGLPSEGFIVVAAAEGYRLQESVQVDLRTVSAVEVTLVLQADPAALQTPGTIIGSVLLKDRGRTTPQAGVTVSVAGTNILGSTDGTGLFQLPGVPPGTHSVTATLSGYRPATVGGVAVLSDAIVEVPEIVLERDVVAPTVVATVPDNGASDVTIEDPTQVVVVFSQKMDAATVDAAISITPEVDYNVYAGGGHPLASPERTVIVLEGYSPNGTPLKFDKPYTITIANTAANTDGVTMEEPYSFRFTTGRAKITGTFPRDGTRSVFVGRTEPILVYFNASIDLETFEADRIDIRPQINSQPEYNVRHDAETGWSILAIAGQFEFGTEYQVTLRGGLRTLGGDRISNVPYTFGFTTVEAREGGTRNAEDDRSRRLREERERQN